MNPLEEKNNEVALNVLKKAKRPSRWDKMDAEQRRVHLDKMRRGRELKRLLKENPNFHLTGKKD